MAGGAGEGRAGRGPALTVDAVLAEGGKVLLIKRRWEPFAGMHALPGGFVDAGESVEDAVRRELREETGLEGEVAGLLGVYSDPGRDPRGHTVSVVFLMRRTAGRLQAGDDAAEAGWFPMDDLPPMAFDHGVVLDDLRRSGYAHSSAGAAGSSGRAAISKTTRS